MKQTSLLSSVLSQAITKAERKKKTNHHPLSFMRWLVLLQNADACTRGFLVLEVVDELSRGCIKRSDRTLAASSSSPGDADFEFSVANYNMLTADQLFHQGRMLPFKGEHGGRSSGKKVTTLRDELCAADDQEALPSRPPKGCRRWKKILGLKKAHNVPPKKPTSHLERVEERAPYRPDIDIRDESKIWGWREENGQSSYRWYVRDKRDLEEEEEEGEGEQEQQEDD
ncbi:hypothetical protein EJ110_NYTH40481 [Nymphaea thermarum]|nr:hypothetical protein EJ110_NYTH40481 [Nymphaea thermarum]